MDDKNDLSTGPNSESQTILNESKSDDSNENENENINTTIDRNINTVEEDNKISKTAEKERKLDDLLKAWTRNKVETNKKYAEKQSFGKSEKCTNDGVTESSDPNTDSNISLQEGVKDSNYTSIENNVTEKNTLDESEQCTNIRLIESPEHKIDSNINLQGGFEDSNHMSKEHNSVEKMTPDESDKCTNTGLTSEYKINSNTDINLHEYKKDTNNKSVEDNGISRNIAHSSDDTGGPKVTENNSNRYISTSHSRNVQTPNSSEDRQLKLSQNNAGVVFDKPFQSRTNLKEAFPMNFNWCMGSGFQRSARKPKKYSDRKKRLRKPTSSISTSNDGVYCKSHYFPVKYWCRQCVSPKCKRCVNVAYSKQCINHDVLVLEEYVRIRKFKQKIDAKKYSTACLGELDRNINVLKQRDQMTQLQGLIQKEKIRQEFISFHHLLIEKEKKILENLKKNIDECAAETKLVQNTYVSLVEEEANLMCDTLCGIDKDDPHAENLNDVDKIIHTKWLAIQRKTREISEHINLVPKIIQDNFTLRDHKTRINTELDTALDPIEVIPLSFIVYLEKADIQLPIKVNDLFTCRNSKHEFHEFELEVTVLNGRRKISQERLYFNDYILNIEGKHFLQENQRYRVQAKPLSTIFSGSHISTPSRNVLIITDKSKDDKVQYIENVRRMYGHLSCVPGNTDTRNENYFKWKQSKLWPFSSVHGSKEFYDISPEELRFLAYSLNVHSYMQMYHHICEDCTSSRAVISEALLDIGCNMCNEECDTVPKKQYKKIVRRIRR